MKQVDGILPPLSGGVTRASSREVVPSLRQGLAGAASLVAQRPGTPLGPPERREFESRFGFDFGSIRIHADEEAARSAAAVGAQAYALGRHIVFGRDVYRPNSTQGKAALAHELSHTIQQWNVRTDGLESSAGLGLASPAEERQAESATEAVLAHRAPVLTSGSRAAVARLSIASKVHSDEDLGDIETDFNSKNDHLSEDQLRKIRNAVRKVTLKAQDYEVLYAFYDYYSGFFGHKIKVMDATEEAAARKVDQLATTSPDSDTKLRSDVLAASFDDARLGSLLLHEFTHTGHAVNFIGAGDFQEGQSYAVEYFYAEKAGDTDRMEKIIGVISSGTVAVQTQKAALQQTFKTSYAVMSSLQELSLKGTTAYSTLLNLTKDDGELLMADFVANFASPSDRVKKIIEYVKANIASFKVPALG